MMIYLQTIDTAEDRSKFERLYEQYKQLMFYTAFQILKRPQDAEDAVHLAFLSIAENISKISDPDCPKTRAYIVTIFLPCDFFTVPIPDSSFNYAFAPVRLYLQIIDIETTAEASDNRGDDCIIAWIVKWIFLDSIGVAIIIPI